MADVVRVLSHHDPKRVQAAAQLIMRQCGDVPAKRVAYGAVRAIPTLMDALRAHPDHAGVQENVCNALWSICIENEANKVQYAGLVQKINNSVFAYMMIWCVIQIAIREADGIDIILLAYKNHFANVVVQDAVCGILRNLSITASNEVSLS